MDGFEFVNDFYIKFVKIIVNLRIEIEGERELKWK